MDGQFLTTGADATLLTAEPSVAQPMMDQGAPGASALGTSPLPRADEPTAPSASTSSSRPAIDPSLIPAIEQVLAQNRQYEQAFNELRQFQVLAQQQQADHQAATEVQSRINQAYQIAETMEPAQAFSYIRRVEDQERANLARRVREVQQASQAQTYQAVSMVAAPLYAQQLVRQHGLPPEYGERLAMLPDPHQMDAYLPVLKREHEQTQKNSQQYQDLLQRFDQLQRGQQAAAIDGSGVTNVSSTTGMPITQGGDAFTPGSREHLLARLGPLLGIAQQRR